MHFASTMDLVNAMARSSIIVNISRAFTATREATIGVLRPVAK
jgi:hypothetical protein